MGFTVPVLYIKGVGRKGCVCIRAKVVCVYVPLRPFASDRAESSQDLFRGGLLQCCYICNDVLQMTPDNAGSTTTTTTTTDHDLNAAGPQHTTPNVGASRSKASIAWPALLLQILQTRNLPQTCTTLRHTVVGTHGHILSVSRFTRLCVRFVRTSEWSPCTMIWCNVTTTKNE